jgi:hypothetical protein
MSRNLQGVADSAEHKSNIALIASSLDLMQKQIDNVTLQSKMSENLFLLLKISPASEAELCTPGLARKFCNIMSALPTQAVALKNLCMCLHVLSGMSASNRACFRSDTALLSKIVETVNANLDDSSLQFVATSLLGTIFTDIRFGDMTSMQGPPPTIADSIMEACLGQMKAHSTHAEVQAVAVDLIFMLRRWSLACAELLLENDGISMIVHAMHSFEQCGMLQAAACNLMFELACRLENNDAVICELWKHGAVGAVLAALNYFLLGHDEGLSDRVDVGVGVHFAFNHAIDGGSFMRDCLMFVQFMYRHYYHHGPPTEQGRKERDQKGVPAFGSGDSPEDQGTIHKEEKGSQQKQEPNGQNIRDKQLFYHIQVEQKGLDIVPRVCAKYLQNREVQENGISAMNVAIAVCEENMEHIGQVCCVSRTLIYGTHWPGVLCKQNTDIWNTLADLEFAQLLVPWQCTNITRRSKYARLNCCYEWRYKMLSTRMPLWKTRGCGCLCGIWRLVQREGLESKR